MIAAAPSQAQARSVWKAGVRIGQAVVIAAPAAGEHARLEHHGVQVAPELGQRSAVRRRCSRRPGSTARSRPAEGQDAARSGRQGSGPAPGLRRTSVDEGLDVAGIAQRLELADPVGFVCVIDRELISPRARPAGKNDPPRQRAGLAEPLARTVGLVKGVDDQQTSARSAR